MGRPINDRFIGNYSESGFQISAVVHVDAGEGPEPGYIVRQRSNSKYLVEGANSSVQRVCKLVATLEPALGEMSVSVLSDEKGLVIPEVGQDETDYDGAGDNGSFVAGSGYAAEDVITLSNGALITVDAISSDLQVINGQEEDVFDGDAGEGTFTAGTGYAVNDVITLDEDVKVKVDAINGFLQLINGQTQTAFDGDAGEGTFVAGSGYSNGDVITLNDGGTEITVVAVGGSGEVTEFTVGTVSGTAEANVELNQSTVAPPGGSNFALTPQASNLEVADLGDVTQFTVTDSGGSTTAGTTLSQTDVDPAGGSGFDLTPQASNLELVGDVTEFTVSDQGNGVASPATLSDSVGGFSLTLGDNNEDPLPEFARIINNRTVKTFLDNIYAWPENVNRTRESINIQGE